MILFNVKEVNILQNLLDDERDTVNSLINTGNLNSVDLIRQLDYLRVLNELDNRFKHYDYK